ncbi:hypothetical protein [Cohnella panacarvi]|uniref:hypothetical protein n=1 Tax=Cohnella panacarvi TaxID=400776 RepID=UPI00047C1E3D|nr:hypothetical protein [Cohnella panacarvi]
MRRDTFKLAMLAAIVAFAVLYGMELSSRGIENVNGKVVNARDDSLSDVEAADEWVLPTREPAEQKPSSPRTTDPGKLLDEEQYNDWDAELYDVPRNDHKPLVDRVSGATAEALHGISKGGIKFVVSLFDKVTG